MLLVWMARTGLLLLLLLSLRGRNRTAGSIEWGLRKDKVKATEACKGLRNGLIALLKSKISVALFNIWQTMSLEIEGWSWGRSF